MARPKAICFLWLTLLALFPRPALAEGGRTSSEPTAEQVARGVRLLQMQGCVSCHSLDGSPSAGPSFAGRYGSTVDVRVQAGSEQAQPGARLVRTVRFDRDYLMRSVAQPDAEVAVGFAAGVMPAFALTREQLDAVEAALLSLRAPQAPEPKRLLGQGLVIGAAVLGFALLFAWRARLRTKGR